MSCSPDRRGPTKALIWVTGHFEGPGQDSGDLPDAPAIRSAKIRRQVSDKGPHLHIFRQDRVEPGRNRRTHIVQRAQEQGRGYLAPGYALLIRETSIRHINYQASIVQ